MPKEKVKETTSKVVSIVRTEGDDYKGSKAYIVEFADGSKGTNLSKDECVYKEGKEQPYILNRLTSTKNENWEKFTIQFPRENNYGGGNSSSYKRDNFSSYGLKSCKNIALEMLSHVEGEINPKIIVLTVKSIYLWVKAEENKDDRLSAIDAAVRCLKVSSMKKKLMEGKLSDNITNLANELLEEGLLKE